MATPHSQEFTSNISDKVGFFHHPEIFQMRQQIEYLNNEVTAIVPELKLSQLEEKIFMDQIAVIQFQETGNLWLGTKKLVEKIGKWPVGSFVEHTLYPWSLRNQYISIALLNPWAALFSKGLSTGIESAGMTRQPRTVGNYEVGMEWISMLCKNQKTKAQLEKLKSHYPQLAGISLNDPTQLSYDQKLMLIQHPQLGYAIMKIAHTSDYNLYRQHLQENNVATPSWLLSPDAITTLSLAHNGGYDYMMRVILQSNIMELARTRGVEVDFNECMQQSPTQAIGFWWDRFISPKFFQDATEIPLPAWQWPPYIPYTIRAPVSWDYDKKVSLQWRYGPNLWFYNVVAKLNQRLKTKNLPWIEIKADKKWKILGLVDWWRLITSGNMRGLSEFFARYQNALNFGYKPYVDLAFVKANEGRMNVDYLDMHKDLLVFKEKEKEKGQEKIEEVKQMRWIPEAAPWMQTNGLTFRKNDVQQVSFDSSWTIVWWNLSWLNRLKTSYIPLEQRVNRKLDLGAIESLSALQGIRYYSDIFKKQTRQSIALKSNNNLIPQNLQKIVTDYWENPHNLVVGMGNSQNRITKWAKVVGFVKDTSWQIVDLEVSLPMADPQTGKYAIVTVPLLTTKSLGSNIVVATLA